MKKLRIDFFDFNKVLAAAAKLIAVFIVELHSKGNCAAHSSVVGRASAETDDDFGNAFVERPSYQLACSET